ncbi:hypothetical protein A9D60_15905 [Leisingera sp. JC1]|nr:hypothetical protein A9D60_15905 [Leisingera sp. JC1]
MMAMCADASFVLSNHAATRMAQRSIRHDSLELVLLHGTRVKARHDCEEYILSGRTVRHLTAAGLDEEMIAAATKVRAIVDAAGNVVTCYHQRKGRSRPFRSNSCLRNTKYM